MKPIVFTVLMFFCVGVLGAPKARNPQECAAVEDMTLVAHALLLHKVEPAKRAAVMNEVYANLLPPRNKDKRWEQWLASVMRYVERPEFAGVPSVDLAHSLGEFCVQNSGNLDPLLGGDQL